MNVCLAEIAEINPRFDKSKGTKNDELVSFVPMSAVSEESVSIVSPVDREFKEVSKGYTAFQRGDLIIAKITPCFENGKMAFAETLPRELGFGSTEFHVIRPSDGVEGKYLFSLLRNPYIRRAGKNKMKGAAGQRRVPAQFFAELKIPLPPLDEQKRIAKILDAADALRAKRRESLAQLDTLLQSTFLDMFGDPVRQDWKVESIENVALAEKGSIRTGPFGSQLLHSEFVDAGIRVLGIDNAVANEFRIGEPRFVSEEKYQLLKRYTVKPGDVLITIMGTCGRCAIVPTEIETSINTKHLCCITLDPEKCHPQFLHSYFLHHPMAREYLERNAKGAIMSGLNMGIIKRLPIPLPPLDLQQSFADLVTSVERQKARLRKHLAELDTLFNSLQQRAFKGEL
ncbi:MAG: restriction endonuclease subunit S [Verrucomicrobia bacterium]|nr:restriction endonuclease subunit S [Verrucomicrobiota bacterium]MDA1065443.1 restriction endonuclease subunit S [Verrucomicrobiota bacterium]